MALAPVGLLPDLLPPGAVFRNDEQRFVLAVVAAQHVVATAQPSKLLAVIAVEGVALVEDGVQAAVQVVCRHCCGFQCGSGAG